jgi:hypothetical protein
MPNQAGGFFLSRYCAHDGVEVDRLVRLEHAVLVQQRQAAGGHAHHRIGLRVGLLGQQLGGDDARAVAHPLDVDVGVHLVEAFLVGLELVGLERGVDQQLGLLRQGRAGGQGKQGRASEAGQGKATRHGHVGFSCWHG